MPHKNSIYILQKTFVLAAGLLLTISVFGYFLGNNPSFKSVDIVSNFTENRVMTSSEVMTRLKEKASIEKDYGDEHGFGSRAAGANSVAALPDGDSIPWPGSPDRRTRPRQPAAPHSRDAPEDHRVPRHSTTVGARPPSSFCRPLPSWLHSSPSVLPSHGNATHVRPAAAWSAGIHVS